MVKQNNFSYGQIFLTTVSSNLTKISETGHKRDSVMFKYCNIIGVAPCRLPADRSRPSGVGPQSEQLLCWRGTGSIQSCSPGAWHWAQSWQDVAGNTLNGLIIHFHSGRQWRDISIHYLICVFKPLYKLYFSINISEWLLMLTKLVVIYDQQCEIYKICGHDLFSKYFN